MERWLGRVACVTGASAGIGEAVTRRLVCHGLKVVGCARNIEKIQKLSAELKDEKGSLSAVKCDVKNEEEVVAMFEWIKQKHGGVDVCVNNAGLARSATLLEGEVSEWKTMLDVNVLGLCICTREAVKSMRERNIDDGHVILLNSLSGHRVVNNPTSHFYAATKHAVKALTEGTRNELRALKSNIRVTAISPGLVQTEFAYRHFDYNPELAVKKYSQYKPLNAEDVADSIIYALSAPPHVQVHDILIYPTEAP